MSGIGGETIFSSLKSQGKLNFIAGKQLHGGEENTSRQVTSVCLFQLDLVGIFSAGTFSAQSRARIVLHFWKELWKTDDILVVDSLLWRCDDETCGPYTTAQDSF